MLRIHQISSAAAAQKYYSGSDYYGQELVGRWGGKGALLLGLEGEVEKQAFDALCDNRHPVTGEHVTAVTRSDRTPGYDFNFNAPKGVSLLYGTTRDATILNAFRDAVQETMADIESEMKTRVRRGRKDEERGVANLATAEFIHFTSRPIDGVPDPSLHAHIVAFNMVHDPVEQAWKAGYFRDVKRDAPYFEALFHNRLSGKLAELGYAVERRGKDWDLAAVPRSLVEKFSRRTKQIEALADELGIVDVKAKAKLGATSREHKRNKLSLAELQQAWLGRMKQPERTELAQAAAKAMPMVPAEKQADETALRMASLHVFERRSVVPYRELIGRALRHDPGHVTLNGIERAAKKLGVIATQIDGRMMATMPELVREEKKIIQFGKKTRGTRARLGRKARECVRGWLGREQKAAVMHALNSTDQVILIEGRAGAGKTTLTEEIVDGIRENGRDALLVAPSAQASRGVLREAGFHDADTLQRLLIDENMQAKVAPGNVVIVDEAGLVGTPTMTRLFDLAEKRDWRLILIFDRNQHRSVERGSAVELLAERAKLPVARVDDIRRQTEASYREAVKMLSDRRAGEGFDKLDGLGFIKEVAEEKLYRQAAEAFVEDLEKCKGDILAISPTHAEIGNFTSAIREKLAEAGKLGEEKAFAVWKPAHLTEGEKRDAQYYEPGMLLQFHKAGPGFKAGARLAISGDEPAPTQLAERFAVYRPGKITLAVGDRVRITANGKSLDGHRLNNGAVYGVAGFTKEGHLQLDNGWTVGKDWGHLDLGWVTTSHSAQSRTVRRAVVVQSKLSLPASKADQLYVSASRAKEQTLFFTDSKAELRYAIGRDDERMSATDLMHRARTPIKERVLNRIRLMYRLNSLRGPEVAAKQPQKELSYERN